jgi:hypothetical protein
MALAIEALKERTSVSEKPVLNASTSVSEKPGQKSGPPMPLKIPPPPVPPPQQAYSAGENTKEIADFGLGREIEALVAKWRASTLHNRNEQNEAVATGRRRLAEELGHRIDVRSRCCDELAALLRARSPQPEQEQEMDALLAKCTEALSKLSNGGNWRSMRDGNQYVETRYMPTAKCVGASRVDGLVRPWNPHAYVAFGFKPDEFETSRFVDADADFIADAPKLIRQLLELLAASRPASVSPKDEESQKREDA